MDIVQVSAGYDHTVGLKADGTVVAVGRDVKWQCRVGGWTDIVQVSAGYDHTVGLKSDGTVIAVGANWWGECYVGDWTDIVQASVGYGHTVGLRPDGTVVAMGLNRNGQCDVANWTDIIQVSAGWDHTVGVKSARTVVAVGESCGGQCDVGNWTDIVQVAAGDGHTVGLESDGSVVAAGGCDECCGCSLPSRCFIATAAYGTPMAGEIEILRWFRDEYLLTNPLGQSMVGLYYGVSPPMAELITEHPNLKPVVRAGLLPAVALSVIAVNTTPVQKAIILALLALVAVVLALWATRRRGRGPDHI
jgi:alpha-tubulin suppressor-like RCC1 family protein